MGTSLGYLTSLYSAAADVGGSTSLLGMAYGSGQTSTLSGGNPITALTQAEKNQAREVKATAAQPPVTREVEAFTSAVRGAKSVTQLLSDPRAMKVLLTANGLADQASYTALARKALMSNVNDSKSLANTLSDTRWKSVAKTYDFANKGLSVIQNPTVISTIANAYAEVTWRNSLDAATPGLSNALTFRAQASTIKSVDQILGDPVLRTVVTTTLGIPLAIAFQPLEAQEKAISTRLDVSKFSDPKFVESFAQRYLIAANSTNSTNSTNTTGGVSTTPDIASLAVQARSLFV